MSWAAAASQQERAVKPGEATDYGRLGGIGRGRKCVSPEGKGVIIDTWDPSSYVGAEDEAELSHKPFTLDGADVTAGPSGDTGESPDDPKQVPELNTLLHSKLVNISSNIEVARRNPNSPLYSVKKFEELNLGRPELLKGVYMMGFTYPSKIQETALPTLLADPPQNMIAQSQSGTGKTAAFTLAALARVDSSNPVPQVLCLSPTYELALQLGTVFSNMAKYCPDIRIRLGVRGERVERNVRLTEHVIIGTPGTVLDWMTKFRAIDGSTIKVFILDEADVMIAQQGHQDQSIRIHKQLDPTKCQMLLFSATYDQDVMDFAEGIIPDPIIIRLRREEETLDNINQYYAECGDREAKFRALSNIYGILTIGQSIIFCKTKKTAEWLAAQMSKQGHSVALLSSDLTIEQRAEVIRRFRDGEEKVLLSTNLTSRGIDVEQVTIVVNFDVPELNGRPDYETYLHRIGRTGRFGKAGIAINFVDTKMSKDVLSAIEKHFGKEIKRLDAEDIDDIERIGNEPDVG